MTEETSKFCMAETGSIRDAIACIDGNSKGIVLVADQHQKLIDTITDGDIRRAILAGTDLDAPISSLIARKASDGRPHPITAPIDASNETLLELMHARKVRQIPLVDPAGRVRNLVTLDDLLPASVLPLEAVVMAGGYGTRLRPLTEDLPKTMLPVGGRPLMERILGQLRQAGIKRVNIATHYKPEKIIEHFGNGDSFGVNLVYVNEDRPLGTAGGLGLIEPPRDPLLVINGDILTRLDFRAMLDYHREYKAMLTIAVRRQELNIPYGVLECEGSHVRKLEEKPRINLLVNAGIYLLDPSVYKYIPSGKPFNMTDLIQWLIVAGQVVVSFPIHEYWLDIGQHTDYTQAENDAKELDL